MAFQYREVEAALAAGMRIKPDGLGAFKAKLRHLRSLGVPDIAKVGSGSRVQYSFDDALTARVALELSSFGVNPTIAGRWAQSVLKRYPDALLIQEKQSSRSDFYVLIWKDEDGPIQDIVNGEKNMKSTLDFLLSKSSVVVLNISNLARELIAELKK